MKFIVISGGQTGADQGGLRAAKALGIRTGGWMPKGFLTEDGPAPSLAEEFGLKEAESSEYRWRTILNVNQAEVVLWFGDSESPGGRLTLDTARRCNRPHLPMPPYPPADGVAWWLRCELEKAVAPRPHRVVKATYVPAVMVAGNRESKAPGMAVAVEAYCRDVFRILTEG